MSTTSTTLLPRQFYLATGEKPAQGWTILAVQGAVSDGTDRGRVWAIRNDVRTHAPEPLPLQEVRSWIEEGLWRKVQGPIKPKVELSKLTEDQQEKANDIESARLALIQPLLDLREDMFWPHVRRAALRSRSAVVGKTIDYLWQLLCLHWQFGGSEGLRPRCYLAGQKSLQTRIASALKQADIAREANPAAETTPAAFFVPYKSGRKKGPNAAEGKPMTWADIQTCRRAARKHLYVPSPDHSLRYRFTAAYLAMLAEDYGYAHANAKAEEVPSLCQFTKAVTSEPEFSKMSIRITGPLAASRDHRSKRGTTRFEVLGPGHMLQIDDVTTKVRLLHEHTYLPIGTANIFAGVDQWAKVIAGGALTLEGSSYDGVRDLFVNVATPKADYFKQLGIDVDPKFFPAHGIFRYCTADKGPLGASLGNMVPRKFCDLSTPGSHRPDMKSDIESSFHSYLRQHAENIPGYNRVERGHGNADPDLVACLTPREFMRLWWHWAVSGRVKPASRERVKTSHL